MAPLTSTPVTTLGCANHITPKSLCGPVNIESVGSVELLCMHTSRPALCYSDVVIHWLLMHVLWLECSQSCTLAFISLHRPLTWNSLHQPCTFSTRAVSPAAHPFTHYTILTEGHGCMVMQKGSTLPLIPGWEAQWRKCWNSMYVGLANCSMNYISIILHHPQWIKSVHTQYNIYHFSIRLLLHVCYNVTIHGDECFSKLVSSHKIFLSLGIFWILMERKVMHLSLQLAI